MIVILHNIRSLYNVGSIFRTADAVGIEKIYLCGITPGPVDKFGRLSSQLAKVSLGAEKYVEWDGSARSPQATARLIDKLKSDGYKIFAIEQSKKSVPYYKVKCQALDVRCQKVALVLGGEIKGLSSTILKKSDKILEIPMKGKKESLNVAVAFGIVAFHLINF